jgi:CBS domain-containing protein
MEVLTSAPNFVPNKAASMKQICDLLRDKGRDVWSLTPDTTVYDAIDQMAQKEVGALLVMEDGRLVGIVSERDYARKVILKGRASRETLVREIMSSPVITVSPEFSVEQTMALMTEKRIRHLPVVTAAQVVGVISIGDVLRGMMDEKEFHIQQLTKYVTNSA